MKFLGVRSKCRWSLKNGGWGVFGNIVLIAAMIMLIFSASHVFAAGDEDQKWVATDTYRIMNFAVLVVGLVLLLRKPIARALSSRIKGIKEQLEDLEARKAAAENELTAYVDKIAKLEAEAQSILDDYIRQGNEAKDRILKEAEAAAEKLEVQAKKNIEHEFEQAKLRLKEDVLEKAMAKAEEIIKVNISTDDQERLVDEYLNKVVA